MIHLSSLINWVRLQPSRSVPTIPEAGTAQNSPAPSAGAPPAAEYQAGHNRHLLPEEVALRAGSECGKVRSILGTVLRNVLGPLPVTRATGGAGPLPAEWGSEPIG